MDQAGCILLQQQLVVTHQEVLHQQVLILVMQEEQQVITIMLHLRSTTITLIGLLAINSNLTRYFEGDLSQLKTCIACTQIYIYTLSGLNFAWH